MIMNVSFFFAAEVNINKDNEGKSQDKLLEETIAAVGEFLGVSVLLGISIIAYVVS